MLTSRNKTDLMIEVWEKLDCEDVGGREIVAIEDAVRQRFGDFAVDSPMRIARLLADEGAQLRHSEIMELHIERVSDRPYDAPFRNLLNLTDLRSALSSVRRAENLRKKFEKDGDAEGLRLLTQKVLSGKQDALSAGRDTAFDPTTRQQNAEIAEWLTIWLQSHELFENWIRLREKSPEFIAKFGDALKTNR